MILTTNTGVGFAKFSDALKELRAGGVVAIPTETVYGLAADIRQPRAIAKIFAIKKRPEFDPLIVHIADFKDIYAVAREISKLAEQLAKAFWPGPLTMVLPRQPALNPMITSGLDTVAVRMPASDLTLHLIHELGAPVAAPSANRFGHTSPTTAAHVETEFSGEVLILDGGPCTVGIESTVIGFDSDFDNGFDSGGISVLRPGAITVEELSRFAPTRIVERDQHSPGHLLHHYMPDIPLIVLREANTLTPEIYESIRIQLKLNVLHPAWMSLPENPAIAARLLYANMREAAAPSDTNCLFLVYPFIERRSHLWAGISDRLDKAATIKL